MDESHLWEEFFNLPEGTHSGGTTPLPNRPEDERLHFNLQPMPRLAGEETFPVSALADDLTVNDNMIEDNQPLSDPWLNELTQNEGSTNDGDYQFFDSQGAQLWDSGTSLDDPLLFDLPEFPIWGEDEGRIPFHDPLLSDLPEFPNWGEVEDFDPLNEGFLDLPPYGFEDVSDLGAENLSQSQPQSKGKARADEDLMDVGDSEAPAKLETPSLEQPIQRRKSARNLSKAAAFDHSVNQVSTASISESSKRASRKSKFSNTGQALDPYPPKKMRNYGRTPPYHKKSGVDHPCTYCKASFETALGLQRHWDVWHKIQ